jgi:hypothetical protein
MHALPSATLETSVTLRFLPVLPVLLLAPLAACSGASDDGTDSGADTASDDTNTDTDTDGDSADSAEPEPVWTSYRIETASTLQGVYSSGQGVYIVGSDGHAWVGSATQPWAGIDPDVGGETMSDLWGSGAGDTLYMVATAATGLVATWSGGGWSTADIGTANLEGIGGSSTDTLFAASFGGIYRWDGATWTFERLPGNEHITDIHAVGGDAFGVGEDGAIVRRSGTEGVWSSMDSGVRTSLNAVAGAALDDVWAVGEEGVALHFDGNAWTAFDTGVTATLWAVFAPASNAVIMVGNNGTAIRWNGTAFEPLPTGVDNNLYAVHGVSGSNAWAVGNRGAAIQFKE